jgi:hypothetical protein
MMSMGPYELLHRVGGASDVERWLARGPMGPAQIEVWTAPDPVLRSELVAEARGAMVLDDPHIAKVIAAGESAAPAGVWIALPADMADDLEVLQPLPPSFAARIVVDLAQALTYAHGRGRVHGALTAQHVLIGYDGVVRVSGWGAARAMNAERVKKGAVSPGLAAALAPEALAQTKLQPPADVYALGHLLALAAGGTAALPVALRALHDQCTQRDPGLRPASAAAVATAAREAAERELGALPTHADLATYLRETVPTRREERVRAWESAVPRTSAALAPVTFNIPRDPSNPGSSIPLFDAAITTLFVREQSGAEVSDPLKQAATITGTWAALSTAFPSRTAPVHASLPPLPTARSEDEGATVPVVAAMFVIAATAFLLGALYLGPSAQTDFSASPAKAPTAARPVVADLPPLPPSDPGMWEVPRGANAPSVKPTTK